MVFSENYDRALWLMIAGDKKNREYLAYFIKTIPQEIYEQICKVVANYGKERFDPEVLVRDLKASDGFNYHFDLDFNNGIMILKVRRWKLEYSCLDEREHVVTEENFQLFLNKLYTSLINNVNREYVGSFTVSSSKRVYNNGVFKGIECSTYGGSYELLGSTIGMYVKTTNGDKVSRNLVDYFGKYPEEVFRTDFSSKDRINNLVRTRKRKSN